MPKLEKSLKRFSKEFGETSAQAVIRWSVQVAREVTFETQPFGAKQVRKRQYNAMLADAYKVLIVADKLTRSGSGWTVTTTQGKHFHATGDRFLGNATAVNLWIEKHRVGRGKRPRKLATEDKRVCTLKVLKQALTVRMKNAGIAKGGFIGAGQDIAKAQTGEGKIQIGRNFLSYAQKHSAFGSCVKPANGFSPKAKLTNRAAHTSTDYVIKASAMNKAIRFGLSKTVKWYAAALRAIDKKNS